MSGEVAVTGIGAVTGLGGDIDATWTALLEGESAAERLSTGLDEAENWRTSGACMVDGDPADVDERRVGRFTRLCLAAVEDALRSIEADPTSWDGDRVGTSVGTGFGGLVEPPGRSRDTFRSIRTLPGMAAGRVSERLGARGPIHATATACAAGSHAIAAAARDVRAGRVNIAIAAGAEAPVTPDGLNHFDAMRALSTIEPPSGAARPFDATREGFILGEGAGALVLERADHADERGRTPLATLRGCGAGADAYHPTQPPADARGLRRAIEAGLYEAAVEPSDVDYVSAHAPGTPRGDEHEASALRSIFDPVPPVSSVKGAIGHTLGAAGAIDAALTVRTLVEGTVLPTRNCERVDPACQVPVANRPRTLEPRIAMANASGFGGANGVLVFERGGHGGRP